MVNGQWSTFIEGTRTQWTHPFWRVSFFSRQATGEFLGQTCEEAWRIIEVVPNIDRRVQYLGDIASDPPNERKVVCHVRSHEVGRLKHGCVFENSRVCLFRVAFLSIPTTIKLPLPPFPHTNLDSTTEFISASCNPYSIPRRSAP